MLQLLFDPCESIIYFEYLAYQKIETSVELIFKTTYPRI